MTGKKNNIRSFRYSDEVAEILEGMEGSNLNEKFENLVRTCYVRLPEVQGMIELYEGYLNDMRDKYRFMLLIDDEVRSVSHSFVEVRKTLDHTRDILGQVCNIFSVSRSDDDC